MEIAAVRRFYGFGLAFLVLAIYLALTQGVYTAILIPLFLFTACYALLSFDQLFILLAFVIPVSVKYTFDGFGVSLPSEPLMLVLLFLSIMKWVEQPQMLKPTLIHPLTLVIVVNLVWITITTFTSSIPLISMKFLLARIWCVGTGFFLGSVIFRDPKRIKQFLMTFSMGLVFVVIYTFTRHYLNEFSQKSATWVMTPLMDDHTVYSAVCAIALVYSAVLFFFRDAGVKPREKIVFFIGIWTALIGVVFSYSRAAALSLIFVIIFLFILKLRVKFKTLMMMLLLVCATGLFFKQQIYNKVRFNTADSGKNFHEDIKSISNIKTDASNVERLNRWESAYRMFKDKPVFGFGPGTYVFTYSPYQRAHEMTIISTTKGTMGGIHSEYFGPIVESGFFGGITTLLIVFVFIYYTMNTYYQAANREVKMLSLAILLALISYFFHGLLNNYLDQDKIALVFWAMMGMAVSLDLRNQALRKN